MSIFDLFYTPFPRPKRNKKHLFWISLIGISCSFFIILFKPFGIENINDQWYFNLAIISMGIVFILAYLFIEWLIPSLIPKLFKRWTLGKAIFWYALVILFIGAIMFLYKSYLAGFSDFTLKEYFFAVGRTFVLALTVSFFVLGLYQYFSRRTVSIFSVSDDYLITSVDGKTLRINPKDILYIGSDDNYVDIHYIKDGKREKIVFRSSLKNVESQLVNLISPIYRCHRQYLINVKCFNIQKMTSKNMMIALKDYDDLIPVSRQYADSIKRLLPIRP